MCVSYQIALIADHFSPRIGGIEIHIAELASRLASRGHRVTVVTTTPGMEQSGSYRVVRLSASLLPRFQIAWNILPHRLLSKLLTEQQFDIVHVHCSVVSPLAYSALYWARRLGIPHLCTIHSLWRMTPRVLEWAVRFQGSPNAETHWSTVSKHNARVIAKRSPFRGVSVLNNGVETGDWNVERGNRRGLNVVSVVRLNAKKRPEDLIRAIPKVLEKVRSPDEVRFTMIGGGPRYDALRRLAERLGVAERVTLTGSLSRELIARQFANADVFAHPTRREALGVAILEAMAAGLPVAAMGYGGVTDLIDHERQGLLAHDLEEFASAIVRLLDDPELRVRLGVAGREAAAGYDWRSVIPQHLRCYEQILESSRPAVVRGERLSQR